MSYLKIRKGDKVKFINDTALYVMGNDCCNPDGIIVGTDEGLDLFGKSREDIEYVIPTTPLKDKDLEVGRVYDLGESTLAVFAFFRKNKEGLYYPVFECLNPDDGVSMVIQDGYVGVTDEKKMLGFEGIEMEITRILNKKIYPKNNKEKKPISFDDNKRCGILDYEASNGLSDEKIASLLIELGESIAVRANINDQISCLEVDLDEINNSIDIIKNKLKQ